MSVWLCGSHMNSRWSGRAANAPYPVNYADLRPVDLGSVEAVALDADPAAVVADARDIEGRRVDDAVLPLEARVVRSAARAGRSAERAVPQVADQWSVPWTGSPSTDPPRTSSR